jgi:hypothetical protein
VTNYSTSTANLYIFKTNSGTLFVNPGASISAFGLEVDTGTLQIDGTYTNRLNYYDPDRVSAHGQPGSLTTVSGTGYLDTLSVGAQAVVSPGDNGIGILHVANVDFSGGSLLIEINGTIPGFTQDQLIVQSCTFDTNNITLQAETSLALNLSYFPQIGDSFLIVRGVSDGSGVVSGTFAGLPQMDIVDMTNGCSLGIFYFDQGVTLTALRRPDSPFNLWKGDGFSRHWSDANDWAMGLVPGAGSNLCFGDYQIGSPAYITGTSILVGFTNGPTVNDLPVGTAFNSLQFIETSNVISGGYVLTGNPLTVSTGISNNVPTGTNTILCDLATSGSLTLEADAGGALQFNGAFTGNGTVRKEGAGDLIYLGNTANLFFGTMIVDAGKFRVDGTFTDSSFTFNGGSLGGTGTVSSVTMNSGSLINPGNGPGILHLQGNLAMMPGSKLQVELNGPSPGATYDQLQVNGTVSLNNANLEALPGYTVPVGTTFFILLNDLADPVAGTFAGLPEGAVFLAAGQAFSISYKAGTGNDIALTRVNPAGEFLGAARLNPSVVQLAGIGQSNLSYTIQASTNLAGTNWIGIGSVSADGTGHFFFNDSNVNTFPLRFFRVSTP